MKRKPKSMLLFCAGIVFGVLGRTSNWMEDLAGRVWRKQIPVRDPAIFM